MTFKCREDSIPDTEHGFVEETAVSVVRLVLYASQYSKIYLMLTFLEMTRRGLTGKIIK